MIFVFRFQDFINLDPKLAYSTCVVYTKSVNYIAACGSRKDEECSKIHFWRTYVQNNDKLPLKETKVCGVNEQKLFSCVGTWMRAK